MNITLNIKDRAPDLNIPDQNNIITDLTIEKKYLLIFFYPKDNTPGCTLEAKDFTNLKNEFDKLKCEILGISKDSIKKHQNFISKNKLEIKLLSDFEGNICKNYGVWVEKSMYGKKYMGIERSTFLIDKNKSIINIWKKVKVKDHVVEVLKFLKNLN